MIINRVAPAQTTMIVNRNNSYSNDDTDNSKQYSNILIIVNSSNSYSNDNTNNSDSMCCIILHCNEHYHHYYHILTVLLINIIHCYYIM